MDETKRIDRLKRPIVEIITEEEVQRVIGT
jgi:hypothetical protein